MRIKNILISLVGISIVLIFPHLEIIPLFGYSILILLLVWLILKYSGEKFSDIGFNFKAFSWKLVLIGSLAAILILCFMQLIFFPLLEQFVDFEDTDVGLYKFIKESPENYIFILIMGWIVGGFYEEIVFHGFIFTRLEKIFPGRHSTLLSFIITSVLFGAYHFQLGAAGVINAFLVGAAYHLIALYFKRNLWSSIICHGVYDTIVITLIYMGYF